MDLVLEPDSRGRIGLKRLSTRLADGYIPQVHSNGIITLSPVEISIKTLTEKALDAHPEFVEEMAALSREIDNNPDDFVR